MWDGVGALEGATPEPGTSPTIRPNTLTFFHIPSMSIPATMASLTNAQALGLSATHRSLIASKYSGRKLTKSEQEEQEQKFSRIDNGDLSSDENDAWKYEDSSTASSDDEHSPNEDEDSEVVPADFGLYDPLQARPLPTLVSENLHHNKVVWRELYTNYSLKQLAEVVMEEEIEARLIEKKALYTADTEWSAFIMQQILNSIDRVLLESLLFGNLAKDRRADPRLEATLLGLKKQSVNQPGIYYQSLVDEDGESPSAYQLIVVCDVMIGYLLGSRQPEVQGLVGTIDDALANEIDNFRQSKQAKILPTETQEGHRKYLNTKRQVVVDDDENPIAARSRKKAKLPPAKKTVELYSPAHTKEMIHFVEMLRKRLLTVDPAHRDRPLQFPLVEVGYSKRCVDRLKQHARHTNSNYIMNIVESICSALQKEFGRLYRIEQVPVYLIWCPEQAEISEIGLTKLAEGYIHNAGGFSHFPAGLSNHSANKISAREWNDAKEFLMQHSVYPHNLKQHNDRLEKNVLALEEQVAVQRELEQEQRQRKSRAVIQNLHIMASSGSGTEKQEFERKKLRVLHIVSKTSARAKQERNILLSAAMTNLHVNEQLGVMRPGKHDALLISQTLRSVTEDEAEGEVYEGELAFSSSLPQFSRRRWTKVMTSGGEKTVELSGTIH